MSKPLDYGRCQQILVKVSIHIQLVSYVLLDVKCLMVSILEGRFGVANAVLLYMMSKLLDYGLCQRFLLAVMLGGQIRR